MVRLCQPESAAAPPSTICRARSTGSSARSPSAVGLVGLIRLTGVRPLAAPLVEYDFGADPVTAPTALPRRVENRLNRWCYLLTVVLTATLSTEVYIGVALLSQSVRDNPNICGLTAKHSTEFIFQNTQTAIRGAAALQSSEASWLRLVPCTTTFSGQRP